jgi:hypothetical protein
MPSPRAMAEHFLWAQKARILVAFIAAGRWVFVGASGEAWAFIGVVVNDSWFRTQIALSACVPHRFHEFVPRLFHAEGCRGSWND